MKFALVCLLDDSKVADAVGLPDDGRGVILFETETEAVSFAVAKLVEAGVISFCDGSQQWTFADAFFDTAESSLDDWQDGLASYEYFHVFPIVDTAGAA